MKSFAVDFDTTAATMLVVYVPYCHRSSAIVALWYL